MEGLIPYIFRNIKRRKSTRRYHKCASSGAKAFGAADGVKFLPSPSEKRGGGHRRHRSLEGFSVEPYSPEKPGLSRNAGFGSLRMLPCTGAAA